MNTSANDKRSRIALVVNPAINDILANGPDWRVPAWCIRIEAVLRQVADDPTAGAEEMRDHYRRSFDSLVQHRGYVFGSVLGGDSADSDEGEGPDQFSSKEFSAIRPKLAKLLAESCARIGPAAEQFRDRWIRDALVEFQEWAATVPAGGTTDKSYRAEASGPRNTAKSLASWIRTFGARHGPDFDRTVMHLFSCERGAIAGEWHCMPSDDGDTHGYLNGRVFVYRDSWVMQRGYLEASKCTFFDDVPIPGSNGCLCDYTYISALGELPEDLLSDAGKEALRSTHRAHDGLRPRALGRDTDAERSWWHRIFSAR